MTDIFSPEKRHEVMSRIKSKDSEIEISVRKWLHHKGFRYRSNSKKVFGCPDISLQKNKIAIFVNGCFWHGHEKCKLYKAPKSNQQYWSRKIERNK